MTEQNPGSDDGFEVPARYLNINAIDIRPADISALVEKSINFISPSTDRFRVTDLTHRDRWRPYRLSVNNRQHVVLFNKDFAADKKAIDYFITVLQRAVTLVMAPTEGDELNKRYRIEAAPRLITDAKRQAPRLMEMSTFCDLLNAELQYDRSRYRVIASLLASFCPKLQTHVENAVIAKFPKLENLTKSRSKNNPRNNNLKKDVSSPVAPPQTVMAQAVHRAIESDDKS